jgi:hypothetical protein
MFWLPDIFVEADCVLVHIRAEPDVRCITGKMRFRAGFSAKFDFDRHLMRFAPSIRRLQVDRPVPDRAR